MLHYFLTNSSLQKGGAVDTGRVANKEQVTIPKRVRGEQRTLRGLRSNYANGRTMDGERLRTALHKRAVAKYAAR